jgi:hypothetical protein
MRDLLHANGEAPAALAILQGRAPDVAPDGVDLEYTNSSVTLLGTDIFI